MICPRPWDKRRRTPWPELRALAHRQRGIIDRTAIEAAGVHYRAITRRVANGLLCERHPGVFTFGHGPLPAESLLLSALAWCGERACLSHLSAAAVFGWVPFPDVVHLTTTHRHSSRPGITVHRTERLPANHVQHWEDLRVSDRSRTLIDLADVLSYEELRRVADELPRLPVAHLEHTLRDLPGRHGAGRVARLIRSEEAHTKSELERRYLAYCKVHGLPRPPKLNHLIGVHKADCIYRRRAARARARRPRPSRTAGSDEARSPA